MVDLQKALDQVNAMRGVSRKTLKKALAEAKQFLRSGGARGDTVVNVGPAPVPPARPQTLVATFLHDRLGLSWDVTARLIRIAYNLLTVAGPLGFISSFGQYLEQEVPENVLFPLGGVLGVLAIFIPLLSSEVRLPPVGDVGEELDREERARQRAAEAAAAEARRAAAVAARRAGSPASPPASPLPRGSPPLGPRVSPETIVLRPLPVRPNAGREGQGVPRHLVF